MTYKEERYLFEDELCRCCVAHNWYTRGTNEQYQALMDMLTDNNGLREYMTTTKLQQLAEDILAHSDAEAGLTVPVVMQALVNCCTVQIVQAPEDERGDSDG